MNEETAAHMAAHSAVKMEHIQEAIRKLDYKGPRFIGSVDLCKTVGKDNCIILPEGSPARQMLFRKNRKGQTPCTLEDLASDTSLITVGICHSDGADYLFTAFYGQLAPKEPWDESLSEPERKESEEFWKQHALVVSKADIV